GNLDIALLRSNGEEIVASAFPPSVDQGREVIRYGVDQGARFLIQVRGAIVTLNTPYALRVNAGPAPACEDDALDPNTLQDPAALAAGQTHSDLIVCGDAPDYYELAIGANQVVRITAQAPDNLGKIRISLHNEDGNHVAQAASAQGTATLYWDTSDAVDMVLAVEVVSGVGNVEYSLEWRQQDNICSDIFDPNDSCGAAPILPIGSYDNLAVCTDADFYKVELLPFQELTARAIYDPATAAGELDIFLFGPNECLRLAASGVEVAGGGTEVVEVLTYQAVIGGDFYLMTNLFQGLHVPYRLELEIVEGPPCVDDHLAGNDTYTQAHEISPEGVYDQTESALIGLRICDNNEDWFKIELEEDDVLKWVVSFRHTEGDVDAFLYGPADQGTPLVSGTSETDDEELVYTVGAGEAGTYYLRVKGKYPVRSDYRVLTYLNGVGPENPLCPDQFGTNDVRERAAEVGEGTYGPLMVCGVPRSEDWFTTFVRAGETLNVRLDFTHADGRIDLRLYDDSGSTNPLMTSSTTRDFEEVNYTSSRSQYLFWRVTTAQTVQWNTYSMDVTLENPDPCVDDRFAGNHNRTASESIEAPGLYTRLRICDDAEDWFTLELEEDELAEAFIRFSASVADLDLFLWGPDTSTPDPSTQPPVLLDSSEGTAGTESIIWTAPIAGTYFVRVAPKSPARIDYDLLMYRDTTGNGVLEGPEDRVCPDQFQNNDTASTARPIAPGYYEELLICWGAPSEHDYFSIFVPAGATLTTNLFFTHADGNIDLRVYRGTTTQEAGSSRTTTDDESVTVTNTGLGETYLIHVFGGGGTFRNYYAMEVALEFAGECDDPTEAGSDMASALNLPVGAYKDFNVCEGSEHWYKFEMGAGENVHVELELNQRFGHIDMELLDENSDVVASDAATANHKTINHDVSTAATYYLRLYPRGDAFIRTSYDLWVSLDGQEPTIPFCTDPYERNDDPILAYQLQLDQQSKQFTDALACGVEEDWFQVELVGNMAYEIAVFYQHGADHNLEVEIQDGGGTVVATSDTPVNDEVLSYTPPSSGPYYIGIRSKEVGVTQYSMHVVRVSAYTTASHCPEDDYSPNHGVFAAAALGSSLPHREGLGACANDDYFTWIAPSAGPVRMAALYNSERLALGLQVDDITGQTSQNVINVLGANNRAQGTFQAVEGNNYRILIGRAPLEGDISNGPYFLHIEQTE
ncbi:MAG: PPC domain-containing protein, partial [Bradymonadaceae bacterium]